MISKIRPKDVKLKQTRINMNQILNPGKTDKVIVKVQNVKKTNHDHLAPAAPATTLL